MRDATNRAVHAAGIGLSYRAQPRVAVGFDYTYGVQLDLNPALYQITALRSHVGDAWIDWMLGGHFGARPLYRFEVRSTDAATIGIHTFELAAYWRW